MKTGPEQKSGKLPEILAPAGHMESFFAAVENGADSVYLGLKELSARASAVNFTLEELARLIPYAREKRVSIFVALNSLVTAPQFPGILDVLQSLSDLQVDALIVQDPGVIFLARRMFPNLKLHASTLMTIHNSAGVRQMQRMGVSRVVLARELSLDEIGRIRAATGAELEIFVHGALCFSYSGLCLTSSFRGGHSGLQGRCVQPCRLQFRQGRKTGYFLSCNDFSALPLVPELKKLGLAALKIEGRMKPADYVGRVVRAYRLVLDADEAHAPEAVRQGLEWIAETPSRRLVSGYLEKNFNDTVLTPHLSGSSGLWVGTVKKVVQDGALVSLRRGLKPGDRLRPESRGGKEETAFKVAWIASPDGKRLESGAAGAVVLVGGKGDLKAGDRLFRIASDKAGIPANVANRLRKVKPLQYRRTCADPAAGVRLVDEAGPAGRGARPEESLIIKVGTFHHLAEAFKLTSHRVLLTASRSNLERMAKQRLPQGQKSRLAWSLPPLIMEKSDLEYYARAVKWFVGKGFALWELNNWGHFDLFGDRQGLGLVAGPRFNLRNAVALAAVAEEGARWSVLSPEITFKELQALGRTPAASQAVVSVYSRPALFTSRLTPKLEEGKPFSTPRGDVYVMERKQDGVRIYTDHPVCWFDRLPQLREAGYRHFLIDISQGPDEKLRDLQRLVSGFRRSKSDGPCHLFNFDREP